MTNGVVALGAKKLPNERMDIYEAFTILASPYFPNELDPVFVVAWCRISQFDQGRTHTMRAVLLDPDGHAIWHWEHPWDIPKIEPEFNFQPILSFFAVSPVVTVPSPGGYRFELFDGDELLGDVPFDITRVEADD